MLCFICNKELNFVREKDQLTENYYFCKGAVNDLCYSTIIYEDLKYFKIWLRIENKIYFVYYIESNNKGNLNIKLELNNNYENLKYKQIIDIDYKLNTNLDNIYTDLIKIVKKLINLKSYT